MPGGGPVLNHSGPSLTTYHESGTCLHFIVYYFTGDVVEGQIEQLV